MKTIIQNTQYSVQLYSVRVYCQEQEWLSDQTTLDEQQKRNERVGVGKSKEWYRAIANHFEYTDSIMKANGQKSTNASDKCGVNHCPLQ